jgi:group II intron reverse transcriptase/maturase
MAVQKLLTEWIRDQCEEGGQNLPKSSEVHQVIAAAKENQPAYTSLLKEILHEPNLYDAWEQVRRNHGAPGIDKITIGEFANDLQEHIDYIIVSVGKGMYEPSPVRRKDIKKPNGGYRMLGIPIVRDRLLAQAIQQVLTLIFDPIFSESNFGFRPGRSAQDAVEHAKAIISEGYTWVVDIDISKFFDRVNHDVLMYLLSSRIEDKMFLKLIRRFLNAGLIDNGVTTRQTEGVPQGSPLSPILANILLDVLDKELEQRGHKFSRYADDCNTYVKSERAAKRVMNSIKKFIENKLKLKLNAEKSAVDRPWKRKFLGFSFIGGLKTKPRIRIAKKSIERFKDRIRQITKRNRGVSLKQVVNELNLYLRGWLGYFGLMETPSVLKELDGWIRRKLRCYIFKQWKTSKKRCKELRKLGAKEPWSVAYSGKGLWRLSLTEQTNIALNCSYFNELGVFSLYQQWCGYVKSS